MKKSELREMVNQELRKAKILSEAKYYKWQKSRFWKWSQKESSDFLSKFVSLKSPGTTTATQLAKLSSAITELVEEAYEAGYYDEDNE